MTYEVNNDVATKVLRLLYESWFKDFYEGLAIEDLIIGTKKDIASATNNQVNQVVGSLQTNGRIIEDDIPRYKITAYGIDIYEQSLSLDIQAVKRRERTKILEVLEELYETDMNALMHSNILKQKLDYTQETQTQTVDLFYLRILVAYLEEKGFVELKPLMGTVFNIRLTPLGKESLKDPINDITELMTNAYRLLFRLENYMRRYIESKLIDYYDNDWWEKGITNNIKKNANKNKISESDAGWQISDTKSNMDFLYFEDLGSIIENNWELFKTIFNDQEWVTSRLSVLDKIRNAIAHTRTLTPDSRNRLDQNYSDLMGKIKK